MMPLYAVMMRHTGHVWIDSLWVREAGAKARHDEMKRIHEAFKYDTGVWVLEVTLQDGEVAPAEAPALPSASNALLGGLPPEGE